MKQEPPFSAEAPSADSASAPSATLLRLLEVSPAAEARRIKALTALLLIAESYPERADELKVLAVRYRSAPTAESARIYLMCLEALVALALRTDALALAAKSAEGPDE